MNILEQCSHLVSINKTVALNEEFINSKIKELKPHWTSHIAKKIHMVVDKDCIMKINGVDEIEIKSDLGFKLNYEDPDVETMVSLTDGVKVYAIIGY